MTRECVGCWAAGRLLQTPRGRTRSVEMLKSVSDPSGVCVCVCACACTSLVHAGVCTVALRLPRCSLVSASQLLSLRWEQTHQSCTRCPPPCIISSCVSSLPAKSSLLLVLKVSCGSPELLKFKGIKTLEQNNSS